MREFNAIQGQVFHKVYKTDENVFIGAPESSGKITCAEMAILREIQKEEDMGKIVYIGPVESLCQNRYEDWKERLEGHFGLTVVRLTGNFQ